MYTNPIKRPDLYVPITEEEIQIISDSLKIAIPTYLIQFFVQYNGACLANPSRLDVCHLKQITVFTLSSQSEYRYKSIIAYFEINRIDLRYSDFLLPFALSLDDTLMFVSLNADNLGSVYKSFEHNNEVKFVHSNFVQFINELEPWEFSQDLPIV